MRAIKDCEFEVVIRKNGNRFYWFAESKFNFICPSQESLTPIKAKANFIKFAELNGITKYKFL